MLTNEIPAHVFLAASLRAARAASTPAAQRAAIAEAREWAQYIQVARNAAR